MNKPKSPIDDVVERLGGLTKAAAALGIGNPSVIANWKARGRIPVDRVVDVERVTGISRHILRPDLSKIFSTDGVDVPADEVSA